MTLVTVRGGTGELVTVVGHTLHLGEQVTLTVVLHLTLTRRWYTLLAVGTPLTHLKYPTKQRCHLLMPDHPMTSTQNFAILKLLGKYFIELEDN